MKTLALSGGAAHGAFSAGVVDYLLRNKKMNFDLAVGTSAGALIGGPALLNEVDYLRDVYHSIQDKKVFKNSLLGKIIGLFAPDFKILDASLEPVRPILSDFYINKQKGLERLFQAKKRFVVTSVNVRTAELVFVDSDDVRKKKLKPETFISAIMASCAMPILMQPIRIFIKEKNHPMQKDLFYDGGVREFVSQEKALALGATELWTIATTRAERDETDWGGKKKPEDVAALDVLLWTISTLLAEVERGDLYHGYVHQKLSEAKNKLRAAAQKEGLPAAAVKKLVKIVENVIPGIPTKLIDSYLIRPTRKLASSREFKPGPLLKSFGQGRRDAKKFLEQKASARLFVNAGKKQLGLG